MENRRATGPDQNVVNVACAECCAWADQVETLREECNQSKLMADHIGSVAASLAAEIRRARAEIRDLERENASIRRRLREGGR